MSPRSISCILCLLLLFAAGTGCQSGEEANGIPAPGKLAAKVALGTQALEAEAAEQEIRKLSSAYLEAYRTKNASAIDSLFADSAVSASSSGALLMGRAAILQDLTKGFAERGADYQIAWEPIDIQISGGGDMAHEIGRWQQVEAGDRTSGHYLTVWEKFGDTWKVMRDLSVAQDSASKASKGTQ